MGQAGTTNKNRSISGYCYRWFKQKKELEMSMMAKLKFSNEQRNAEYETAEDKLRARLLAHLGEQLELAKAEQTGERVVRTRQIYVTNEAGERVLTEVEKRLRKWFWHNVEGSWFIELRYGGKVLKLDGKQTAVEVGDKSKLAEVIGTLMDAVKAGELDRALLAAKKERAALMRKRA
jgi:hypothetical protein